MNTKNRINILACSGWGVSGARYSFYRFADRVLSNRRYGGRKRGAGSNPDAYSFAHQHSIAAPASQSQPAILLTEWNLYKFVEIPSVVSFRI